MSSVQRKASHKSRGPVDSPSGNSGMGVIDAQGAARNTAAKLADRFKADPKRFYMTQEEMGNIVNYITTIGSGVGADKARALAMTEIQRVLVEKGLNEMHVKQIWATKPCATAPEQGRSL